MLAHLESSSDGVSAGEAVAVSTRGAGVGREGTCGSVQHKGSGGLRRDTQRQHEAAGVDVDAGDSVDDDNSRLHHLQAHHGVGEEGQAQEDLQHHRKS